MTPARLRVGLLAIAVTGCASDDPHIADAVAAVEESRLQQTVEALTANGPRAADAGDGQAHARALSYLEQTLGRLAGLRVYRERFSDDDGPYIATVAADGTVSTLQRPTVDGQNLIAELPGATTPERIIEIGAHYDSVRSSPGADDDASGVAAVLEIARVIAARGPMDCTLRVCLFDREEDGLVGSEEHVRRLLERGNRVEALLNFEMVGYTDRAEGSQDAPLRIPVIAWMPTTGDFVLVAGSFWSGWLGNQFERCADRYVPGLRYFSANRVASWFGDSHRSDHAHYWEGGIPAIMLSDTAEFRNRNYHRASDTASTLDYGFLGDVTRAGLATVLELGTSD